MNIAATVLLLLAVSYADTASATQPIDEITQRVLDARFPLTVAVPFDSANQYVIRLRRIRPAEQELMVELQVRTDGDVIVRILRPQRGSISQQVARRCEGENGVHGDITFEELTFDSKRIPVLRRLVREFEGVRFSPRLDPDVYLDAPLYQIGVSTAMNHLVANVYGDADKRHPIIKWADAVEAELLRIIDSRGAAR